MMKNADGKTFEADLTQVSNILKKARYQGFVVLEYEENEASKNVPLALERLRKIL